MIAEAPVSALLSRWKQWGAGFNVPPCPDPANLEQLLVDTAGELDQNPRLLVMAVTWLAEHYAIVETGELRRLAERLHGRDSARLGLLLEAAQEFIGAAVFAPVIEVCRPWQPPEPLLALARSRPVLAGLAEQQASRISRKWGLWAEPVSLKQGVLRPPSWIARQNPTFMLRCLLKGDVRSKVVTALAERGLSGVSETELTRRAGCTRRAMHLALENLVASGLIVRERRGRSYAISLAGGGIRA